MGVVGRGVDGAAGNGGLHRADLLVRDGRVTAYPQALKLSQPVERGYILDIRAPGDVQVVQPGAVFERGDVGDVGGVELQVLKLRAAFERGDIPYGGHGDYEHLKLRHIPDKVDAGQLVIMAEVKVLDLGAVLKNARVIYHPADGRLGGEDALGICAHAVIGAEPDTPHDVYIRELFAYFGKRFVGNAGVVHVQI